MEKNTSSGSEIEKASGQSLRSIYRAPSHVREAYFNDPKLHQLLSRLGGQASKLKTVKKKPTVPKPTQLDFNEHLDAVSPEEGLKLIQEGKNRIKKGSELDGLVTSKDLKHLQTYILGKNELQTPRELSDEEKKRIAFRKRFGWSIFDPVHDIRKRDVVQQIQNPMYRGLMSALSGGVANAVTPLVSSFLMPGGSKASKIFKIIALAGAVPPIANIKNNYEKQLLYNRISEEYLKHHQEGTLESMPNVVSDMTTKKKTPRNLQLSKTTVKTSELTTLEQIMEGGPLPIFSAITAPFDLWGGYRQIVTGKKDVNDIRERFERKLKDKAEAEQFVQKVRMPLYRKHVGVGDKIKEFEEMFKTSADKAPVLEHQRRAIEKLKRPDQPGLILMHGLGSGKTRSSIEAYKELGLPTEVVLPASLRGNYEKELKKWLGGHPKDIKIKSQQLIARNGADPKDFDNKLMILDEAHRMRNEDTKFFRALKDVHPKKRLLLTGTPIYNHPADIAKLINVASGRTVLPEKRPEFENEYISQKVVFPSLLHRALGVKPGQELAIKNKDFLRHVFKKMIDYHGGSSEGFPEMTYESVRVPMEREQENIYKALMKDLPWHLRLKVRAGLPPDRKELDKLIPFLSGARMISNSSSGFTDARHVHSPKIEAAAKFLKERLKEDPQYKALIYSNYLGSGVDPYKKLLDESGISYGEFTGNVNDSARNEMVKKYNEDKLKALIVSSAGGEGLDLKGTRLVQVLEPHYNNEKIKQVVGRAARYLSHANLPEDKRKVLVQNYLATLNPRITDKVTHRKRVSSDEYLQNLSDQKESLNNAFINLIKESGMKEKRAKSKVLRGLIEAKKLSDNRDYIHKNELLKKLIHKHPDQFKVDSHLNSAYVGVTHIPSGFKIHAQKSIIPGEVLTKS